MTYSFDSHGWLSLALIAGRTTEVEPPAHGAAPEVGRPWPNFTGVEWVTALYSTPVVPVPETSVDPAEWLIDIGPFFDRFGSSKLPILMSADATVKAIVADVQVRKYVDLKRPDVASALDYITSKGIITASQKTVILTTPVGAEENLALRKLFFS